MSSFTLDATGSYDNDKLNFGRVGLAFAWSCVQAQTLESTSCNLNMGSVRSLCTWTGSATSAMEGVTTSFQVEVFIGARSAYAVTSVTVVSTSSPLVRVAVASSPAAANATYINTQGMLTLTAAVSFDAYPAEGALVWSVSASSISVDAISFTPTLSTLNALAANTQVAAVPVLVLFAVYAVSLPQRQTLVFTAIHSYVWRLVRLLLDSHFDQRQPSPGCTRCCPQFRHIVVDLVCLLYFELGRSRYPYHLSVKRTESFAFCQL